MPAWDRALIRELIFFSAKGGTSGLTPVTHSPLPPDLVLIVLLNFICFFKLCYMQVVNCINLDSLLVILHLRIKKISLVLHHFSAFFLKK